MPPPNCSDMVTTPAASDVQARKFLFSAPLLHPHDFRGAPADIEDQGAFGIRINQRLRPGSGQPSPRFPGR